MSKTSLKPIPKSRQLGDLQYKRPITALFLREGIGVFVFIKREVYATHKLRKLSGSISTIG